MRFRKLKLAIIAIIFAAQPLIAGSTETPSPVTSDVEICDNETIPQLYVSGTSIKWYGAEASTVLIDSRGEGQTYQTVNIGGQVWMAENLNVGTRITGSASSSNNGVIEKYCLDNSNSKCDTYGGLYQWDEVMAYSTAPGAQGICPSGWHIPSNEEWKQMEIALGMTPTEADQVGSRGPGVGTDLKVNGSSGFEALMAGKRETDGSFQSEGAYTSFWCSSEDYTRTLSINWDEVYLSYYDEQVKGFSVRCVQNESGLLYTGNYFNTGESEPGVYTYYVSQTVGGVESERVPITLTIHPAPTIQITGDTEGCEGDNMVLDAGYGYNYDYNWNTGGDARLEQVNNSGIYKVTVTDVNGCVVSDQVSVIVHDLPDVTITGDAEACEGETVDLDAGAYSAYSWSNGSTARSINVSSGSQYSVTVLDANNCSGSDQVQVVFHSLPVISIEGDTKPCIGTSVELDAGSELYDFLWSTSETSRTINVSASGNYSVTAKDIIHGCESSGAISVSFVQCDENHQPDLQDLIFDIKENSLSGTLIGQVKGTDSDVGQLLTYSILYGNENSAFHLESETGNLKVYSDQLLDHETNPQFILRIQVQDNGAGLLTDEANITVNVVDVNEVPLMDDQEIIIYENIPRDAWVGAIMASDQDIGQTLSYKIEYGNNSNAFKLDPSTGGLRVNNPEVIDYEQYEVFNLEISITDDGVPPLSTRGNVDIILNDLVETGMGENGTSDLRIFPNPTGGIVSIELGNIQMEELCIDVFDYRGMLRKQILPESMDLGSTGSLEIDLEESGVYFIKVYSDHFVRMEKVICY